MLERLAEDLWTVNTQLHLFGGVRLPLRMTVVRLASGEVVIHSPTKMDAALAARIEAIGPPRALIAPNAYHHLWLQAASNRFPNATVYASPALLGKRPELPLQPLQEHDPPALFGDALQWVPLEGVPKIGELVFLHAPSRSLLVTDALFNIVQPANWQTRLTLSLISGAQGKLGASRLWTLLTKDREALRASTERLLALDFDRLIPAHGDIIDTGAKARVSEALASWRR